MPSAAGVCVPMQAVLTHDRRGERECRIATREGERERHLGAEVVTLGHSIRMVVHDEPGGWGWSTLGWERVTRKQTQLGFDP